MLHSLPPEPPSLLQNFPSTSRSFYSTSTSQPEILPPKFSAKNTSKLYLADSAPASANLSQKIDDSMSTSLPIETDLDFKSRSPTPTGSTPTTVKFRSLNQPVTTKVPAVRVRVLEVTSDRQEYDEVRQVMTAEGHVIVKFDRGLLDADRVQVNLNNLIAVGEGNVALTRGNQVLRGQNFTYNLIQDSGDLTNGSGEIYLPTTQTDFAFSAEDITASGVPIYPLSDRIRASQPLSGVNSPGGIQFYAGGKSGASNIPVPKSGGTVKRLRFVAKHIYFYPQGWTAYNVQITNDPFSPPELELRASQATLTHLAPLIDRLATQDQRIVLDQNTVLPIPIDHKTIDRRPKQINPTIVSLGYDANQRGGIYIQHTFNIVDTDKIDWSFTPQFFLQRAIENSSDTDALYGFKTKLNTILGPKTTLTGTGELTSFDLTQIDSNLKASIRLHQLIGNAKPYTLNLEYSYRNLLYNGSLGYQTVQSNLGGVIISPSIPVGKKTGITLNYQASAQYINANTDRQDLITAQGSSNTGRISLGRFQTSASLSRGFSLWKGKPLPSTQYEGLHYTPNPVVPYLNAVASIVGTSSYYTSGDSQSTLTGNIGLIGQIGHFSRPFLDYTAFILIYSQGLNAGLSPFLFDRSVDNRVLNFGITQQLYGPFRFGFQTSVNLDTGKQTSTDYALEYSRRSYSIVLRYNPVLQYGGLGIRISDFNWTGGTDPFSDDSFKPVIGGVIHQGN